MGGWSDEAPAGPQVQDIADSVQSQVEDLIHGGRPFPEYQALKYSYQVVAGANWAILMEIAGGHHANIQIMVHEPLSYTNESNHLQCPNRTDREHHGSTVPALGLDRPRDKRKRLK